MQNPRYSNRSPSVSSVDTSHQRSVNGLKSPISSEYEYLGRLVTRERPIIHKSKSIHQNLVFPPNKHKYHQSMGSQRREIYEQMPISSDDDQDFNDPDGLSKPLGVIRISDRHFREIYRLPTPPPTVRRVHHRLRSPEPKIIERVFVRRPPPQIIENFIEVPPEKVRIINREKYLDKSKPITRSKLIHLKSRHQQREEQQQTFIPSEQYSQQQSYIFSEQYPQQQTYIPSAQYSQQQTTTIPLTTPQQQQQPVAATALVYPPQANINTAGYLQSTLPPHMMFNSQQPLQIPTQPTYNQQMIPPTSYTYQPQQTIPNSPYGYTQY